MNSKNKSAKDLAFEKERVKMRQEKRELELTLTKDVSLARLQRDAALERAYVAEVKLAEQQEWIDRLLEYTEMSKEDIRVMVEENRQRDSVSDAVHNLVIGIQKVNKIFGTFKPLQ